VCLSSVEPSLSLSSKEMIKIDAEEAMISAMMPVLSTVLSRKRERQRDRERERDRGRDNKKLI
jgi:hypothetical protein